MQFDPVVDTSLLCRVCMTAKEGHRSDLHDTSSIISGQSSLYGMLKAICAPVFDKSEVNHPVGMPTKVCAICRNAILAAFKLHQTCIDTNCRLMKLLTVKRELHDLQDDGRNQDPLLPYNKEALQDEMSNPNVDGVDQAEEQFTVCIVKTDNETQLPKEEQLLEEMDDSFLPDSNRETTIKVEALDLMEASDNDNGNDGEHSVAGETSEVTCKLCSKSFANAAMLQKHMTLKHQEKESRGKPKVYNCNYCAKTFKVSVSLRKHKETCHQNVNDPNQTVACSSCEESFATNLELQEHKKTHTNSINCSCGRTFKSERRFKEHTASGSCSGELDKRCKTCDKTFKSVDAMVRHRNSVHSEPVVCSECGKTLANFNSLRMHLRIGYCSVQKDQPPTETALAARTCKICGELQKTRFAIKGHMQQAHPERMFRCDTCGKEFQVQRYLDLHIMSHTIKTYQCQTCNEILPTKEALKKHRRTHRAPNTCTICGKVVGTKNSLTAHMERHVGFKPFSCDICPMRFFTKAEIRGHMLTHSKKQDHVCDLCGSRFTTNHSLKKHVMHVHEGQRPFPCSLCSLKFAHANQLQRHIYTHTGEKPHKCELCPQAYAQTNDLVKHVARAHGDGNPYLCDRCDEGFRLLTDLRQHYRVHVQSTESGADQMEEVRFTSVAILKRAFAKAKQRLGIDSGSN